MRLADLVKEDIQSSSASCHIYRNFLVPATGLYSECVAPGARDLLNSLDWGDDFLQGLRANVTLLKAALHEVF